MTEKNVLLLNSNNEVVNVIVIDEDTPSNFLTDLVATSDGLHAEVTETIILDPKLKDNPGIGWRRKDNGKFMPPPVENVSTSVDVVTSVMSDDRLNDLTPEQTVTLEKVLTERFGEPVDNK